MALALRTSGQAPGDDLRLRARDGATVELGVVLLERLDQLLADQLSIGKCDADFGPLPEVTHVRAERPGHRGGAGTLQLLFRLGLEALQPLSGFLPVHFRDELRLGVRLIDARRRGEHAEARAGAQSSRRPERAPAAIGTMTRGMRSLRATSTACTGPAPPVATIVNSRGS